MDNHKVVVTLIKSEVGGKSGAAQPGNRGFVVCGSWSCRACVRATSSRAVRFGILDQNGGSESSPPPLPFSLFVPPPFPFSLPVSLVSSLLASLVLSALLL